MRRFDENIDYIMFVDMHTLQTDSYMNWKRSTVSSVPQEYFVRFLH